MTKLNFTNLSTKDLKSAIRLGRMNFDMVKPEFQGALANRIEGMEAELANRQKEKRRNKRGPQTKISYSKEFLDGALKDITVPCSIVVPAAQAARRMEALNRFTKSNPGREPLTNATFWIYGIGSQEAK